VETGVIRPFHWNENKRQRLIIGFAKLTN